MQHIASIKNPEENYNTIIGFYDFAEKLIATVEHNDVKDKISHFEFVEPVCKRLEEAADVLSEEYRNFVATGEKPSFLAKKRIEKVVRSVLFAIEKFKKDLEEKAKTLSSFIYLELQRIALESEKNLKEDLKQVFFKMNIPLIEKSKGFAGGLGLAA